jgi:hypothetical protein
MDYLKLYSRHIHDYPIDYHRYITQRKRAPRGVHFDSHFSCAVSFYSQHCTLAPDDGSAVYLIMPYGFPYGYSDPHRYDAVVLRAERLIRERGLSSGRALSIACREAYGFSTNYLGSNSTMPYVKPKVKYVRLPIHALGKDFAQDGCITKIADKLGAQVVFLQSYEDDYLAYCELCGVPPNGTSGFAITKDGAIIALYSGMGGGGDENYLHRDYRTNDLRDLVVRR